jgi:hypothetical protein
LALLARGSSGHRTEAFWTATTKPSAADVCEGKLQGCGGGKILGVAAGWYGLQPTAAAQLLALPAKDSSQSCRRRDALWIAATQL